MLEMESKVNVFLATEHFANYNMLARHLNWIYAYSAIKQKNIVYLFMQNQIKKPIIIVYLQINIYKNTSNQ